MLSRYCSSFLSLRSVPESLTLLCIRFRGTRLPCWNAVFPPGIDPGQATLIAAEQIHDDYAYVFEAHWDLWTPDLASGNWVLEAVIVKFIVQGEAVRRRNLPADRAYRSGFWSGLLFSAARDFAQRTDSRQDS